MNDECWEKRHGEREAMNKIEQVKAVYRTYYGVEIRDDCAEEICQLFTVAEKDRGCQERVEALIAEIEKLFRYLQVGDDIMDVAGHTNKGGPISYWLLPLREWQALKQREGVEVPVMQQALRLSPSDGDSAPCRQGAMGETWKK